MEDCLVIGYSESSIDYSTNKDYSCLTVGRKSSNGILEIIKVHYGQDATDTYNFLSGRLKVV